MLAAIGVIFFAVMIAAALVSLRAGAQHLRARSSRWRRPCSGSRRARWRRASARSHSGDEIGQLAGHLDHLLDAIDEKTGALQRWNAELDAKVAERTRDLETAQQQLVRSEKLAAVGQLTASIAHEVNNPIAVIQGNLDLVRELLGRRQHNRVQSELKLVDEQIERMRLIVTQLLQFARPNEFAGYVDAGGHRAGCWTTAWCWWATCWPRTRIEVQRELLATHQPAINRNELQQVLVNLLVNAIHAMPDGGTLTLGTRDVDRDGDAWVELERGRHRPRAGTELLSELFKPFVTRKKDGTGLGLWISRSIVERYGGDLRAGDRIDGCRGAVFTVLLKLEASTHPADHPAASMVD